MNNLEQSIAEWRQTMSATPNIEPDTLDELETHLREIVEELVRSGVGDAEAFQRAAARLGTPQTVAAEFQKLNAWTWLPTRVVTGMAVAAALVFSACLVAAFAHRQWDFLLAAHVFAVTLGYGTTLLLGVLGICFVSQRCHADLPPRRLQRLSHVTRSFARVAVCLTALGLILGMIWSHREWGRFWSWDAKEIGALAVVVWLVGFLFAHRSRRITVRGLFVASLLGSNLVFLAWFGPHLLLWGLHSYGFSVHGTWLVVAGLTINVLFFLVGLAPSGWLRLRKA